MRFLNIRFFKIGGISFLKLGRINISFSISRQLAREFAPCE